VAPRTRPQSSAKIDWSELPADVQSGIVAGVNAAEAGEFADLTAQEIEHYLETGELPERGDRWVDSYDSLVRQIV
jgi:hypothetical protein